MAKSTPENKRRRADMVDDDKPKSKQKTRHIKGQANTPPSSSMTSPIATSPPPVRHNPNPKVTASAAQNIPPPPMDDDMVPPVMTSKQQQQSKASSKSQTKQKESKSPAKKEPTGYPEEEEYVEHRSSAKFSWLLAILLFLVAGSAGFVHQRIVQELQTQSKGHSQNFDWSQKQLKRLIEERNEMKDELEAVRTEYLELVQEIRATSRRQLISRFGAGPYYEVELELQFSEDSPDAFNYMSVELDGENMPHAVLTFLSQVDQGLYNTGGFAFHHNGDHIVYGSPVANHLNENEEESWQLWETSGVSQLVFHEYTDQVPHVPYTIGFSERGPNLYFNVLDNTELHADLRDPCFGKVTRGSGIIDRMHMASGELQTGDWKEIEPGFVAIRSISILNRG